MKRGILQLSALTLSSALFVTSAKAIPYASGIKNNGGIISFVLNEDADSVKVALNGGSSTNDLGALSRGTHTFNLGASPDFQIIVANSAPSGWTQTSSDYNYLNQFFLHHGVAVNANPTNLVNFGRIYVSNGSNATTVVTGKRLSGDGIYILNADQSDALGRGNTPSTGGLNFTPTSNPVRGNTETPYRLEVGPEGNLYIADYSTNTGTIYVTDPDVKKGTVVLEGLGRTANPGVHTTISGLAVKGTLEGGDLVIHAVDGNFTTGGSAGVQLQWNIGSGPLPWNSPPNVLGHPGHVGVYHLTWDIDIAPDGKVFTSLNRQNTTANGFNMQVYDTDGTTKLWDSKLGGASDLLFGITGIKVSPDGTKVAAIRYDNQVHVIPLTNGIPDLSSTNIVPVFPATPTSNSGKDVAWDAAGNLYVISNNREALRVFSPGGDSIATTSGDASGANGSFAVSVSSPSDPYVLFQPQPQWGIEGGSATFTARAGGTGPFTYQWKFQGTNISGATANTLTLTGLTTGNQGDYSVTITGANGPVMSASAALNVYTKPVILAQPQDLAIIAGSNATFGVEAVGATSYQWLFNGANFANQTNNSVTRANAQGPSHAGYYSVVLFNSFGAITSSVATLTIVDSPPVITMQPISAVTVGAGSNAPAFAVTTVGSDPRTYQWQVNGTNILGATAASYTRNNVQKETAGDYWVVVSNPFGVVTSSVAVLTVEDITPPNLTLNFSARTVAAGSNVTFTATARGNDPRYYQWQFQGTDIPGATNSSYILTNAQVANDGEYLVYVSNVVDGNTNSVSAPAALTVTNTPIRIYSQPVSRTNGAGVDTAFTVQSWGDDPRGYQWYRNDTAIPDATNNSFTVVNPQISDSGTTFYCVVTNNSQGTDYSVTSSTVSLTVTNRVPVIVVQPTNQVTSVGGNATFSVVAQGEAPLSYQWRNGTNNISGATDSSFTISNAQLLDAGTNYNVVVTSSGGSTTSQSVQLAVTISSTTGSGIGLWGEYFGGQYAAAATNSNHSISIPPTVARVDSTVDFNFGTASPDPSMAADYFLVRWTGQVQPLYSQVYTFHTRSDDGVRLWVNNQLVIDRWVSGGNQNYSAVISNAFVAGQKYDVRLEYLEVTSGAEARLFWSSDSQIKEAIATSQLYTNSGPYLISIAPTSRVMNVGDSADPAFTAYAGGTGPLNYQWRLNGTNVAGATSSSLALNNVQLATAGNYSVVVTGPLGAVTNSVPVPLTVAASVVAGTGTGLTGEYFSGRSYNTPWYTNAPTLTRLDSMVDFAWGASSPDISVSANTFVVRWSGKVQPQLSQVYTFDVVSDDGARLWVDGQLIIDSWATGGTNVLRVGTMPYAFVAGQTYDIRLEVLENTGAAEAHLGWSTPNLAREIIPTTQLYPQSGPFFVTEPIHLSALASNNLTMTVYAGGAEPLTYQWKKNGANITGATTSALTFTPVLEGDAGDYSVGITNALGGRLSTNGTLTVNVAPFISQQPQDVATTIGGSADFNVVAGGTAPLSYQWQFNGTNIVDATDTSYTLATVANGDVGNYSVIVSSAYGSITSSNAVLSLGSNAPGFSSPVLSGANLILNWSAIAGRTYRLEFKADLNDVEWNAVPPDLTASGNTLSVTNAASGGQGYYRVVLLP